MVRYFKGKSIRYNDTVELNKFENIIIWITGLLLLFWIILSIFLIKSTWLMVLIDFAVFIVVFLIWIFIILRKKINNNQ